MYPKSPFKAGSQHAVYTNVRDDNIIHYNTDLISCTHDKCTFLKLRGHVNKINEQLYNLKVSNKYIGEHPSDAVMAPQIKSVMAKLNMIKQTMRVKALALMDKYDQKDEEGNVEEEKQNDSFTQRASFIRRSKSSTKP